MSDEAPRPGAPEEPDPADVAGPPVLAVDVDGVISLFGFGDRPPPAGAEPRLVDGLLHCIALPAGPRLRRLAGSFELVWATGWEERANEHLPGLLGIGRLPVLRFGGRARFGSAHWKLGPLERYARGRALAWVDDCLGPECEAWAQARPEPTLLVATEPSRGLQDHHVELLIGWARRLHSR